MTVFSKGHRVPNSSKPIWSSLTLRNIERDHLKTKSGVWTHHRTTERQLPYRITCYRLNPSQTGRNSIYLPLINERLSWHRCWLYT